MEFPELTINEYSLQQRDGEIHLLHDFDKFLKMMYEYYANKGFGVIILSEICSVLSLGFTVFFTTFLVGVVNWSAIYDCYDEPSCSDLSSYLLINPFHEKPTTFRFIVTMYFLLLFSYWIYSCQQSYQTILESMEMESFYREHLKIGFNDIDNYQWYHVLERFIELYESDRLPFHIFPPVSRDSQNTLNQLHHQYNLSLNNPDQIQMNANINHKPSLTIPEIILRIMRKENYLIALINKNKLDLYLPWWISPYTTEQLFLTKTMEWSLQFCVFDHMFLPCQPIHLQHHHQQRPSSRRSTTPNTQSSSASGSSTFPNCVELSEHFVQDIEGLKSRFQLTGMILFCLMPFTFFFLLFNFILENTTSFHFQKTYLGPRIWTPLSLWQFREFNELKHLFQDRMNKAYEPTVEYLQSFKNNYLMVIGKFLSFISGAIITILLLLSFLNEELLMYYEIWNHNLLWYLGIFTAIYAIANSSIFLDSSNSNKLYEKPEELIAKMSSFTHHYPLSWKGKEHTTFVYHEVSELLVFKVQAFLMELSGVILTPIILCFSLPKCAPTLVQFIKRHSKYVDNVGTVCDYSLFEFDKYGDQEFGSVSQHPNETSIYDTERLHDGKLEKSFINFHQNYPTVEFAPGTVPFIERVDVYRSMMKNRREREITSFLEKSLFKSSFDPSLISQSIQQAGAAGSGGDINPYLYAKSPAGLFRQHSFTQSTYPLETHLEINENEGNDGDIVIPATTSGDENHPLPTLPTHHPVATQPPLYDRRQSFSPPPAGTNFKFPTQVIGSETPNFHKFGSNLSSPAKKMVTSDYFPFENEQQQGEGFSPVAEQGTGLELRPRREKVISDESLISPKGSQSFDNNSKLFAPRPNSKSPYGSSALGIGNKSPRKIPRNQSSSSKFPNYQPHQSIYEKNNVLNQNNSNSKDGHQSNDFNLEDMPSLLLSVFNQKKIDYQNDFYWLEKFRRDKRAQKAQDFEKSLHDFQQSRLLSQGSSSRGSNSNNNLNNKSNNNGSNNTSSNNNNNNNNRSATLSQQNSGHQHHPDGSSSLQYPFAQSQNGSQHSTVSSNNDDGNLSNQNSPIGMYAANINRNMISSPKLTLPSNRKSLSNNSINLASNSSGPGYPLHSMSSQPRSLVIDEGGSNDPTNLMMKDGHYYPYISRSFDEKDFHVSKAEGEGDMDEERGVLKGFGGNKGIASRLSSQGDEEDPDEANEKSILLTKFEKKGPPPPPPR